MDLLIRQLLLALFLPHYVYPALANGVVITASATAWTYGAFIEVVPASTLSAAVHDTSATDFRVMAVNIQAVSTTTDDFQLALFSGAVGSEVYIGGVDFHGTFVGNLELRTGAMNLTERISAKLACKAGSSHTATISLRFVEL